MEERFGGTLECSNMIYNVFSNMRESIAVKKFRETTRVLNVLGYSKEEIIEILSDILKKDN